MSIDIASKMHGKILTFLALAFIVLNSKDGFCQTCGPKQTIKVSEDELQKLVMNDITPPNSYMVKSGIEKITMNCTGEEPVLWVTTVAKGYTGNVTLLFYVNSYTNLTNSPAPIQCHTASIILEGFDETVTAVYYCTTSRQLYYGNENVHIFGGNELSKIGEGSFLQRGQIFSMNSLGFFNALYDHSFGLDGGFFIGSLRVVLPCALNSPNEINDPNSYACKGLFCVDFKSIFEETDIPKIHRGFTITCKTANNNNTKNSVTIVGRHSPDFIVSPEKSNIDLYVRSDQKFKFSCRSVLYVRIEANYDLEQNVFSRVVPDNYYKYQAEMEISSPLTAGIKGCLTKWRPSNNITVSCKTQSENVLYKWFYNLHESTSNNEVNDVFADNIISLLRGECTSLSFDSTVYFVPCSTYTECQMKVPFLEERAEKYKLPITGDGYGNSPIFKLRKNVAGMLRCLGFQKDISVIFYPNMDAVAKLSHYPLSSERIMKPKWESIYGRGQLVPLYSPSPSVSVNVSQIIEEEYIRAQCKIQLMLVLSYPTWILKMKNATVLPIPSASLIDSKSKILAEIYTVSTTLKIPSKDVVGIACRINLLQTVPPIIWKNGVLVQKTNVITSQVKEGEAPLEVFARPQGSYYIIILVAICGVIIILITVSFVWLYFRHQSLKNIVDRLSPEEIEYFRNGRPELISDKEMANNNAQNLAYDASREIAISDLELDFKTILGSGEFGIVFKGYLKTDQSLCVAVKTVKAGANAHYVKSAMAELKVMLYIKDHENIVGVIGACTQDLIDHQIYVVLEYCGAGDLLGYLRKNSNNFVNEVSKGLHVKVDISDLPGAESDHLHQEGNENIENSNPKPMTTSTLIHWAMQIANGMKYISSMNMIHGDLAARNILLDSNLSVKISDFGLSKKLYQYSNYIRKGNVPLPWRWLAVESLNFTEFSPASDVWAFAITLWEIFSLGATPYPGQEYNAEFVKMLTNGFRLGLPEFSTYEIYNVIQECWKKDPSERPSFSDIQRRFDAMTGIYTNL